METVTQKQISIQGNEMGKEKDDIKFVGDKGKKKQRIQRGRLRRYLPHALVGIIVVATLRIVASSIEVWPTAVQLHIIFAVVGYQVFMGHGSLIIHTMAHKDIYFFPNTNKKKLHWITTGIGAVFAAAGNAVIYNSKEQHLNSYHGILGALALGLTLVSTVNGTVYLYWEELGIPKGLVKFVHLVTGTLAFIAANACLMLGYNKKTFFRWTTPTVAYGLMAVCLLSIALFSLSPGRFIVNKLMRWDHDKNTAAVQNGDVKLKSGEGVKKE